jgi:hypothetical protein
MSFQQVRAVYIELPFRFPLVREIVQPNRATNSLSNKDLLSIGETRPFTSDLGREVLEMILGR